VSHDHERYSPCVEHHVEEKPPYFYPLVRSVDEYGIYGYWSGRIQFSSADTVVGEKSQLEQTTVVIITHLVIKTFNDLFIANFEIAFVGHASTDPRPDKQKIL
jgi:hypothetical protein